MALNNNTEDKRANSIELEVVFPTTEVCGDEEKTAPSKEEFDALVNEIYDVFKSTKFNKISFPVTSYRRYYTKNDSDENKIITVGYVKKYNFKTGKFIVNLFSNVTETIKSLNKPALVPVYTTYDNKLGTIIRLTIVDIAEKVKDAE